MSWIIGNKNLFGVTIYFLQGDFANLFVCCATLYQIRNRSPFINMFAIFWNCIFSGFLEIFLLRDFANWILLLRFPISNFIIVSLFCKICLQLIFEIFWEIFPIDFSCWPIYWYISTLPTSIRVSHRWEFQCSHTLQKKNSLLDLWDTEQLHAAKILLSAFMFSHVWELLSNKWSQWKRKSKNLSFAKNLQSVNWGILRNYANSEF